MARYYNKSTYLRRKEIWFASLFVASLALVVVIGKLLGNKVEANNMSVAIWYLFIIALLFIMYAVGKIFRRKSDLYSYGIWGEQAVGRELRRLSDEFTVIHGARVPGVGDIDYIVIGPYGVFAVEVKSHRGWFYSGNKLLPHFVRQTKYEAQQLRRHIEKQIGRSIWVEAVLALSRGRVNRGYFQFDGVSVLEKQDLVSFIESLGSRQGNFYNIQQKLVDIFV